MHICIIPPHRAGGALQNVVDRLPITGLQESVLDYMAAGMCQHMTRTCVILSKLNFDGNKITNRNVLIFFCSQAGMIFGQSAILVFLKDIVNSFFFLSRRWTINIPSLQCLCEITTDKVNLCPMKCEFYYSDC